MLIPLIPGISATAAFILTAATSIALAQHQTALAKRKARDAYNASLTDRLIPIRSGVMPRQYVLGTCRVAGGIIYGDSVGTNKTAVDTVSALCANKGTLLGHYMDDVYIAVADFPGEKYGKPEVLDITENFTVVGPDPEITLSVAPVSDDKTKVWIIRDQGTIRAVPVAFTRVGAVITVDLASVGVDVNIRVTYKANSGVKLRSHFLAGTDAQAAHSWGDVSTPLWTADHRARGICALRTLYLWDEDIWAERGASAHGAVIQGGSIDTHPFFDPRDDSNPSYTDNPAILAGWFSTLPRSKGGLGYPSDWIDWDSVAAAANICDEMIEVRQLDGTGYEEIKRYQCHTVLSTANSPLDNLNIILGAMGGRKVFTAGKYRYKAGAFTAAALTITDADVVGTEPIGTSTGGDPSGIPNVVTGIFADASMNWQESSPLAIVNQDYIDSDGSEEPLDLRFPASTDPRQVNYLMGIALESSRPAFALRLTVGGIGENIALLDTVEIELENRSAYTGRTFEVVGRIDHWNGNFTLELAEIKAATYALDPDSFTPAEPATVPDTSYLWNVAAPANLDAVWVTPQRLPDGTSLARVELNWDPSTSEYVVEAGHYNVRYRRMGGDGQWVSAGQVPGDATSTTITGAFEDEDWYQFQVQAENGIGARSEWSEAYEQITGNPVVSGTALYDPMNYSNLAQLQDKWELVNQSGEIAFVTTTSNGGKAIRVGNNSGIDTCEFIAKDSIPFSPEDLYEVAFDIEMEASTSGTYYLGVKAMDANGNNLPATTGTYHYLAASAALNTSLINRATIRGYFRGTAGSGTGTPSPDIASPALIETGAVRVAPIMLLNYGPGAAQVVIHSVTLRKIEDVTVIWRGAWSSATEYFLNDGVTYQGRSFAARSKHTNQTPPTTATSNTYWTLVADRGTAGIDGRMIVGEGNCVVSANAITKQGGTTAWDSHAYSLVAYETAHIRFKASQDNIDVMVGFNTDPLTDQNYTSIDRAWHPAGDGQLHIYESGSLVETVGTYTTSTVLELRYDGTNVYYYKNGILERTTATTGALFFDSSFYAPAEGINSLLFGPGTVPGQIDTPQLGAYAITESLNAQDAGPTAYSSGIFDSPIFVTVPRQEVGDVIKVECSFRIEISGDPGFTFRAHAARSAAFGSESASAIGAKISIATDGVHFMTVVGYRFETVAPLIDYDFGLCFDGSGPGTNTYTFYDMTLRVTRYKR